MFYHSNRKEIRIAVYSNIVGMCIYVLECICMYTLVCMDVKAWGACQVFSLLSTYVLGQCLSLNLELSVSPSMARSLQRFPLFTTVLGLQVHHHTPLPWVLGV